MSKGISITVLILLSFFSVARAATTQSFGAGAAVTSADYIVEFEASFGAPDYIEDGLVFSNPNLGSSNLAGSGHMGFFGTNDSRAVYSGNMGDPLSISTQDGSELMGLEFNIGTGWSAVNVPYGYWETYRDTTIVGSGAFQVLDFNKKITFADDLGFDVLRIAMLNSHVLPTGFNGQNAIAIDHLTAQGLSPVPVPAAVWLFGTALMGFMGLSRRRKIALSLT